MGKLDNEANRYRLDEFDPKNRNRVTLPTQRDFENHDNFKHMAINTIAHMVFGRIRNRGS